MLKLNGKNARKGKFMRKSKKTNMHLLALISLFSALICVCSFISIPFVIPITLQLFGVYIALFTLGGKRGLMSVLLYISIGAVGLPVFSGFTGGISRLFDATGGYIFGFVILSLVYFALSSVFPKRRFFTAVASGVSLMALYLSGSLWYAFVYLDGAESFTHVLYVSVLPFVVLDAAKIFIAYIISERILVIIKNSID